VSAIGSSMVRRDARVRVTGAARYTQDVAVPGMLHAVLVPSPIASGGIVRVDTLEALRVPGCLRALTAADLPDRRYGHYREDQPILARDVVRFVGEPVAIVAATSRAAARRAAAAVHAEIDPLPAVTELARAASDSATTVHGGETNVLEQTRIRRGDVERALADAPCVVMTRIESHRVHQAYLEPRAVLVQPTDDGISVTMSTQQPFHIRAGLAQLFELPVGKVDVHVPAIGGGFGGKLHFGFAPQATAMALATGRSVQLVCSRAEDMVTGAPRENSIVELTSAVDADGRIRARRAEILLDAGAYALDTPALVSLGAFYATGPYDIEALDIRCRGVYTNTCPTGSFRGPTGPQLVYAVEAHMDEIADELEIEPLELRRRNFVKRGGRGPTGEPIVAEPTVDECLATAQRRLDAYRRERERPAGDSRPRGYGLACAWWSTLGTQSGAIVEAHEDGTVTVSTGGTEIGTGAVSTGIPALVADELGLRLDAVNLRSGSTRDAPFESGSRGSRTQYSAGNAALIAAREVARQLKQEAALLLEVAPEELRLADGRVGVAGAPDASLPLADVVRSAMTRSGPVVASGRYRAENAPLEGSILEQAAGRMDRLNEPTFHCHGVEIALDEETGRIEVLRYVAVHDAGRIVNPVGARGQVEGGVVQGIGYALTEELLTDREGRIRNGDLVDYRIPTIADVPRSIETIFVESSPALNGPRGAKGLGEPPVILPAAAIAAALRDILGRRPHRLPFDAPSIAAFVATADTRREPVGSLRAPNVAAPS
jgi:CO/xanthine dehydrogenase Mo-binding subunit